MPIGGLTTIDPHGIIKTQIREREGDAMNEKLNKEINRIKKEVANIDKTNLINTIAKIKERIGK